MKRAILILAVLSSIGFGNQWIPYSHRYAIVVMGGNVQGQLYRWYWNDTAGQVWTFMDWGFSPENIIFLSYGDSASAHPELVDNISTYNNVKSAFSTIAEIATFEDLVYVWWVDHGNSAGFEVHNGFVHFSELREWIDSINCKVYVGAYNPCYSGAIMPYMDGLCNYNRRVITATSVNANQGNAYGWAGKWRSALRGGCVDDIVPWYSDKNHDGYITFDEAYEWEAPHSNNAGEYPLFDDNGDGVGGNFLNPATYDSSGQDSTKDGYFAQFYNIMTWLNRDVMEGDETSMGLNSALSSPVKSTCWHNSQDVDVVIEWSIGAQIPAAVCRGASGLIDNKIYIFGGHPNPAIVHYEYDIDSNTWSEMIPSMPIPGSLTRGIVYNDKLYIFGGHTLGSDTMRLYNPIENSWTTLSSPYPNNRFECCKYGAALVGNKIYYYYMEQRFRYKPIEVFWEYDIEHDLWTEKPLPPGPQKMYIVSASDGEYCYAVGGLSCETLEPVRDAMRYDPFTEQWEPIDSLPEPIAFADGDFLEEYLFIAGGGAGYAPWPATDKVYCWKEGLGWMLATPLPSPVGCPHVELATINDTGYIFVFGGYDNGYLNTLYIGKILNMPSCAREDISQSHISLSLDSPNLIYHKLIVEFTLPKELPVDLSVYSVNGRKLKTLFSGVANAGSKKLVWDGKDRYGNELPRGTYFLRLKAGDLRTVRKLVVLK